ncbi:MAG TPA: arabinofuranosidase catalytic domain-containing protein [Polyangiaceae bacterium]|nr:arabinofuranosidase catalytic domain-containing protein [Polyangiaceae bacterium]
MAVLVVAGCASSPGGTPNAVGGGGAAQAAASGRGGAPERAASGGSGADSTGGAASGSGGAPSGSGGASAQAGSSSSGGFAGSRVTGGAGAAGRESSGGLGGAAGALGSGGAAGRSSSGGAPQGGFAGMAGAAGSSAAAGKGGAGGAGGSGTSAPCDIYAAANTPCVAAHSTVRALFGAYAGPLYQVRRASDKTTKDVPVLASGGFADTSVQSSFCAGTTCTISILYDQTANKNDLTKSPVAHWLPDGGNEANAANGKISASGHVVYGIYVTGYGDNVAYRNNATKGVARGDAAESMYMVVDGKRHSDQCCFDYGNAETTGNDEGNGTMEAVYFGSDITWGGQGDGSGPWVAADLENGVFKSDKGGWQSQSLSVPSAKSIVANFALAMLKGPSGNHFTLKGGDAQSGALTTMWDGVRPSPGYSPKSLQGAIILGTGGDGSNGGTGTFYEGAMTSGSPPDSVDDAIQANVVAAGYGR